MVGRLQRPKNIGEISYRRTPNVLEDGIEDTRDLEIFFFLCLCSFFNVINLAFMIFITFMMLN